MAINDPRDISGLKVWYSAQYEATQYANLADVTTMHDLSGNGNNSTLSGVSVKLNTTGGPGGGPKFACTGGYYLLPNIFSGATAGEMMQYVKSGATTQGSWGFGSDAGNSDESHYPFTTAVFESFGLTTGQRQFFTVAAGDVDVWRRYNVWSANNDFAARLDETSKVTANTTTVTFTSNPTWLCGRKNGATDLPFVGDATTLLLYNRKLTTTERSDLATWLTNNPSGGTPNTIVNLAKVTVTATPRALTSNITIPLNKVTVTATPRALKTTVTLPLTKVSVVNTPHALQVIQDKFVNLGKATTTLTVRPLQKTIQFFTPEDEEHSRDFFFGRFGVKVGVTLIKRDGHYVRVPYPWLGELAPLRDGIDYFLGGHIYTISDQAIQDALVADGWL